MLPNRHNLLRAAAGCAVLVLGLAACGDSEPADAGETVKVGVLTSTSGLLASYGQQFTEGFTAGLDYATDGGTAGGTTIEVTYHDDATEPEIGRAHV